MIGLWQSKASAFLRVLAVGTLLAFGLPMLLWPLGWAAAFGWDLPADTDLAVYFGRCLASVICILGFLAFRAAARPTLQPFYFDIMIGAFALMVGVHVYGGLQGIQPRSETLEVAYWLLMILLALLFYPRAEARSAP